MPAERIPRVPDHWSAWAFSDIHGVTSGFLAALRESGLVDAEGHWAAGPATALVGCGDYVDGGGDTPGLVALLVRLEDEARAAGSGVFLARGNHEAMMRSLWAGHDEHLDTWLAYGGRATLEAYGCAPPGDGVADFAPCFDERAPGLRAWLDDLSEAVRWRDICFVHGGLPPAWSLDDLGVRTDEHLWVRSAFFETARDSDLFSAYRRAGVERVVFGHTPHPDGAVLFHDGRSIDIDSNAVGGGRLPPGSHQELTLLGLQGDVPFDRARRIVIPTRDAPDAIPDGGPGSLPS